MYWGDQQYEGEVGHNKMGRRMKKLGLVVLNAKLNDTLIGLAMANSTRNPLYKVTNTKSLSTVRDGQLIFTIKTGNKHVNSFVDGNDVSDKSENSKISGITVLNGQCDKGMEGYNEFCDSIHVIGIVEHGNGISGDSLFNAIVSGALTASLEGKHLINVCDYLEAYAPTLNDLQGHSSKNGEVHLWTRPINLHDQSATPKQVYQCLTNPRTSSGTEYMNAYKSYCELFIKSTIETAAILVSLTAQGSTDEKLKKGIEFKNTLSKIERDVVIESLFPMYTRQRKYIYGSQPPKNPEEKEMKRMQDEAVAGVLAAHRVFIQNVNKNVYAKALSTADANQETSILLTTLGTK
jgi:hypothetical protein